MLKPETGRPACASENAKNSSESSYRSKEQRRLDAQRKNRIKELEALIENAETRLSELDIEMTQEEVFSDYRLMAEKCSEADTLRQNLELYYEDNKPSADNSPVFVTTIEVAV